MDLQGTIPSLRRAHSADSYLETTEERTPLGPRRPIDTFKHQDVSPTLPIMSTVPVGVSLYVPAHVSAPATVFALLPGREPENSIGLDIVLQQFGSSIHAQTMLSGLLGQASLITGKKIDAGDLTSALHGGDRLTALLQTTPQQISSTTKGLDALIRSGAMHDSVPTALRLPAQIDLNALSLLREKPTYAALKPVVGEVYYGDIPNASLSEEQAAHNIALAEVLNRLGAQSVEPIMIAAEDRNLSTVQEFLDVLIAQGHTITAEVALRITNFADLKVRVADGKYLDIPAAIMIGTGIYDTAGKEAVVPVVHSELVISVTGPTFNARIKWFQGMDETGFFPCDLYEAPPWLGHKIAAQFAGSDAVKATQSAQHLGDVIRTVAKQKNLSLQGYGQTGVCNDSVAVVQHVLQHTDGSAFPYVMRDPLLVDELQQRATSATSEQDRIGYETLLQSILAVPDDLQPNASQAQRALTSIPWAPGQEPFAFVVEARRILEAAVAVQTSES